LFFEDVNDSINQLFVDFNLTAPNFGETLDIVDLQVGMTTPIELIVYFKEPGVYIEVVRNELG
jgi:hypothetical protein